MYILNMQFFFSLSLSGTFNMVVRMQNLQAKSVSHFETGFHCVDQAGLASASTRFTTHFFTVFKIYFILHI